MELQEDLKLFDSDRDHYIKLRKLIMEDIHELQVKEFSLHKNRINKIISS